MVITSTNIGNPLCEVCDFVAYGVSTWVSDKSEIT